MAKAKKVTTAVSTQTATDLRSLTANDVPGLLETVSAKIAELQGNIPEQNKTTGELSGFGKIKEIEDVETLVKAHSMVVNKARVYAESAKTLGIDIKKYPFKLDDSTAEEWVIDIQRSVNVVKNKVELAKLMKIKSTLEENLSAKAKLSRDLQSISDLLNE